MAIASHLNDWEFAAIVAGSRSWRDVLRRIGAATTSTTGVRRRAETLGLDTSHFTGQRPWSDAQLADAIECASTWNEVSIRLGTASRNAKRRAIQIGLTCAHLDRRQVPTLRNLPQSLEPNAERLSNAGESLAAAWLQLAGCTVAMVAGQASYDILAVFPDGRPTKVQVKTARRRDPAGNPHFHLRAKNYLSSAGSEYVPYGEDEVDYFFLIADIDEMWLVPHSRVLGQTNCHPGPEYEAYRIRWPGKLGATEEHGR